MERGRDEDANGEKKYEVETYLAPPLDSGFRRNDEESASHSEATGVFL